MFKNWLTNLNHDDNPRLKRLPFLALWVAAYGLAWWTLFFVAMLGSDWVQGMYTQELAVISIGLCFGVVLAVMQGWLLRRRYGFIPRFWRGATVLGTVISAFMVVSMLDQSGSDDALRVAGMIWFSVPALMQAGVLMRVNRGAWLLGGLGIGIGLLGILIDLSNFAYYNTEIWAILVTAGMQAFGTGILTMRVMANPREGIVPKRDSDEKAKARMRQTLHPITFTALWVGAYFFGWVMLFVIMAGWMLVFDNLPIISSIGNWLDNNAEWVFGMIVGAILGAVSAWMQTWLIAQYRGLQVKGWLVWSTIGWALGGIGFYLYTTYNYQQVFDTDLPLAGFFIAPAIFQMIPMMRARRAGWMWVLTGVVSYLVALTIEAQFVGTYNETFFAVMLGGAVYAILTATAFIVLSANAPANAQAETV
ncbi:MAG: hypothetical protein ACFE0Q_14935 [Anaerolineae bacterium]